MFGVAFQDRGSVKRVSKPPYLRGMRVIITPSGILMRFGGAIERERLVAEGVVLKRIMLAQRRGY
jgi:hypothetical protein